MGGARYEKLPPGEYFGLPYDTILFWKIWASSENPGKDKQSRSHTIHIGRCEVFSFLIMTLLRKNIKEFSAVAQGIIENTYNSVYLSEDKTYFGIPCFMLAPGV